MPQLPNTLDTARRITTTPASPLVAAWGSYTHPIIVRCGVALPATYDPTAELVALNVGTGEVGWYAQRHGSVTVLTSVRRPVKVDVTLPSIYRGDVVLGSITRVVASATPPGADSP